MLALVGRLMSGSLVIDAHALGDVAALLDATIQCEPGTGSPVHVPDRPVQHGSDRGIIALASALSQPSPTLTPAPMVPLPRGGVLAQATAIPPARGPPAIPTGAALPRGPPNLA